MTERDDDEPTLGERLRRARKAKGLSHDRVADALIELGHDGASRHTIIRWEQDKHVPGPEYRQSLSDVLGLPPGFFPSSEDPGRRSLERRVAALEAAVDRIEQQLFGAGELPE